MQIRTEQIQALNEPHQRKFLDRLVEMVSGGREPARSDPAVRQTCREWMFKAGSHGLATEFEVATFVACGFQFGPEFDIKPQWPFHRILTEPDTAPRLKAAQLSVLLNQARERAAAGKSLRQTAPV